MHFRMCKWSCVWILETKETGLETAVVGISAGYTPVGDWTLNGLSHQQIFCWFYGHAEIYPLVAGVAEPGRLRPVASNVVYTLNRVGPPKRGNRRLKIRSGITCTERPGGSARGGEEVIETPAGNRVDHI